tara:strand:+ start:7711 stop:8754 length:1044 start_codon:yes stop_codon:yes gene_type:complete
MIFNIINSKLYLNDNLRVVEKVYKNSCFLMLIFIFVPFVAFSLETKFPQNEKIRIFLPNFSVIEGDEYSLGEIAQIDGENSSLLEKLSKVVIGRSPLPGRKLTVTRSLIISRLRSKKLNSKIFVFPGSDSSIIQRAALKISGQDIEQVVLKYIEESNINKDLKPRLLAKIKDIFIPRGQVSYVISPRSKNKKEGGYRNYEVEFSVDGKPVRKVFVRTYLKLYKEIFVARDTIKRNQVIEESDLLKLRRNVDRIQRDYLTDKNQIIGKISTRTLNPSEVFSPNSIANPLLVNSGDRLQIVFETPFLRLSAPGISLAKGREGDRIPVKNEDSKTVVFATVKTKNIVQVN